MRLFSILVLMYLLAGSCQNQHTEPVPPDGSPATDSLLLVRRDSQPEAPAKVLVLDRDVRIKGYFAFLDSVIACQDTLLPYPLTEHLLVRANPWLIERLANTDYYRLIERDSFVYDQKAMTILWRGDPLILPGPQTAQELQQRMKNTIIDLNIPTFRLHIIEAGDTLYTFPVRVGRNQKKYLALADAMVDLRTLPGNGRIIRIARYPVFINPSDGKRFTHTRRDDGRTTLMPLIPWIEPEINGQRYGQLIHPTTNPATLNKAYSNGCIGVKEADAWYIYYYAPVGTRVHFYYDLISTSPQGDTVILEDIYNWKEKYPKIQEGDQALVEASKKLPAGCVCEEGQ